MLTRCQWYERFNDEILSIIYKILEFKSITPTQHKKTKWEII